MHRTSPINWRPRNGTAPLQMSFVDISGGATPLRKKREYPKGGERKESCMLTATNTPHQIGSNPS